MPFCAICLFPIEINAPNYNEKRKQKVDAKTSNPKILHELEEPQEIK